MISLLIAFAALSFFYVVHMARKRRAGFAGFAVRRGLRYEASAASLPLNEFSGFSLFHAGWDSTASHLIYGRHGNFDLYIFEYASKSGPQMNDPEASQSVVALRMEALPPFRLAPSSQEVKGLSEADLRSYFPQEFLQRVRGTSGWNVEGNGRWVLFWQSRRLVAPSEAGVFLDEVVSLARSLSGIEPESLRTGQ